MNYLKISFICICALLYSLIGNKAFSYYEDKMFCSFSKDKIVISLDDKKSYTCKVYIRYFEVQMKLVYKDILLIQQYVDKKQDLGYWNPLKEERVKRLNDLQNIRLNTLSHMNKFESNLIETSKRYFLDSIKDYQKKLKRSLVALRVLEDISAVHYISLVEGQLDIINQISEAETIQHLNERIKRYVYLKKEIEGK